jgi:hypothetical protein
LSAKLEEERRMENPGILKWRNWPAWLKGATIGGGGLAIFYLLVLSSWYFLGRYCNQGDITEGLAGLMILVKIAVDTPARVVWKLWLLLMGCDPSIDIGIAGEMPLGWSMFALFVYLVIGAVIGAMVAMMKQRVTR